MLKKYLSMIISMMLLMVAACGVAPMDQESGAEGPGDTSKQVYAVDYADEYLVYLELHWEEAAPGDCDYWYPYNPESFYVPVPDPGSPCSAPPQPNQSGVYNGGVGCDMGGGLWYSAWYENLELEPPGPGGMLKIQTEDEWGRFLCVLQYNIVDVEPVAPMRVIGNPAPGRTALNPFGG